MKFQTTSIDTESDTLNISLVLDSTTTDIILRDKKYISSLGPMIKYITTIIGSSLISYQIGEVCLVMPMDTYIHVSTIFYSQSKPIEFQDV